MEINPCCPIQKQLNPKSHAVHGILDFLVGVINVIE
jgi:hypothetical protein